MIIFLSYNKTMNLFDIIVFENRKRKTHSWIVAPSHDKNQKPRAFSYQCTHIFLLQIVLYIYIYIFDLR